MSEFNDNIVRFFVATHVHRICYVIIVLYNCVYFVFFCNCMFLIQPLGCNIINKVELNVSVLLWL